MTAITVAGGAQTGRGMNLNYVTSGHVAPSSQRRPGRASLSRRLQAVVTAAAGLPGRRRARASRFWIPPGRDRPPPQAGPSEWDARPSQQPPPGLESLSHCRDS